MTLQAQVKEMAKYLGMSQSAFMEAAVRGSVDRISKSREINVCS